MSEAGKRFVKKGAATAALSAMVLALGCGKVRDTAAAAGHAGPPTDADGSPRGVEGAGSDAAGLPSTSDNGGPACPGTQVRIRGRCTALGTVEPCGQPQATGFPGDSQCIEAPNAALGMQLHFGPRNYADPDEVARFVLPPGEFDGRCMFMKTPNAAPVHVKEWHARVRPGAYEALLFETHSQRPESASPESCVDAQAGNALVSMAGTDLDLTFDGGAPEFAGAGMSVAAHTGLAFYVSMWNTTDAPLLVEAWLNGLYAEEPVTMEVAPVTWLGGLAMNISPHSAAVVQSGAAATQSTSCVASGNIDLLALMGSTGSHTTRMTAYVARPGTAGRTQIYESYVWNAHARLYYDSVVQNPLPDPNTRTTGGPSGELTLHPGDAISWECAIDNTTDANLTYSDDPLRGELCNFYGAYGGSGQPWQCF